MQSSDRAGAGTHRISRGLRERIRQGLPPDPPARVRHPHPSPLPLLPYTTLFRSRAGHICRSAGYHRPEASLAVCPQSDRVQPGSAGHHQCGGEEGRVAGTPGEKFRGTDVCSHLIEQEQARTGYREVFEKGFVKDYPLTLPHESGTLTHLHFHSSPTRRSSDLVLGIFAAARDITAQKQASQYARSLIESSLDPLVTISAEGKITDVNEGTLIVTRLLREKLIGTDFSNYFTEPEQARTGYREVFEKGFVTDYPLTIRHESGRLTDVLFIASVHQHARATLLPYTALFRSITAQKQASQYARSLIESSLDPLVT